MKAARIHEFDATPVIEDVPNPDIAADEVLVRVEAASLNPLDVKMQKGFLRDVFPISFPYTLGTDLAGTIDGVGSGVSDWYVGDPVVARVDPSSGGALAEFAVVPAAYLVAVPDSVALLSAAGIPTAAATAHQALFDVADLQRGQSVLIHAGAGGVGSFAIQFAHAAGARVIATASGDGVGIVKELGADEVIDYREGRFWEKVSDLDVVLDTVAGETTWQSAQVLRPGGILVSIPAPPDPRVANGHEIKVVGLAHQSDAALLKKVVDQVDAGAKVLVDRAVALTALDEAFERQRSGRARGKILLTTRAQPYRSSTSSGKTQSSG